MRSVIVFVLTTVVLLFSVPFFAVGILARIASGAAVAGWRSTNDVFSGQGGNIS